MDADANFAFYGFLPGFSNWSMVLVCVLYINDFDSAAVPVCGKIYRKARRLSSVKEMELDVYSLKSPRTRPIKTPHWQDYNLDYGFFVASSSE